MNTDITFTNNRPLPYLLAEGTIEKKEVKQAYFLDDSAKKLPYLAKV